MTKKYKIHEAAKDFDIQSKDLIELVSKYFDGEKKYQTALEEKELDLVFDLLSKQNAPKRSEMNLTFVEYFFSYNLKFRHSSS